MHICNSFKRISWIFQFSKFKVVMWIQKLPKYRKTTEAYTCLFTATLSSMKLQSYIQSLSPMYLLLGHCWVAGILWNSTQQLHNLYSNSPKCYHNYHNISSKTIFKNAAPSSRRMNSFINYVITVVWGTNKLLKVTSSILLLLHFINIKITPKLHFSTKILEEHLKFMPSYYPELKELMNINNLINTNIKQN